MPDENRKADVPTHLSHKPILIARDYVELDEYGINSGDAKHLSIGRAQWNDQDLSAKILRKTDLRWSRQSEEMPLTRVIDLAILIVAACRRTDADNPESVSARLGEEIFAKKDFDFLRNKLEQIYLSKEAPLKSSLKELKRLLDDCDLERLFKSTCVQKQIE